MGRRQDTTTDAAHGAPLIELSEASRNSWRANRYVVLRGALDEPECERLRKWTEELAAWRETPGKWMKYYEPGPARLLCRVENFLPYHTGLCALLERRDLQSCLEELMGEPSVLFKEKLNFKLPGGGGFAPHQDAPAFTSFGQTYHVTLLLGADRMTQENGCLEVVDGFSTPRLLPQEEDGTLRRDLAGAFVWQPLPLEPGDVVLFDSYVPHRSGPNRSAEPRRALYVSYNRASEGDRRAEYFALKRRAFPPECERVPGAPLDEASRVFNLGNPIR
jgi:hypothetical protein